MRSIRPALLVYLLLLLFSCEQPGKKSSSAIIKLPPAQQGLVDRFRRAATLIAYSLDEDRKQFLEDSLKNTINQWLSDQTGLKADRWLGVVINDTLGQGYGADRGGVLQLYFPVAQSDTSSGRYDFVNSITLTMSVDDDDPEMVKARKGIYDGDTIVFSGYFEPLNKLTINVLNKPGDMFNMPSLDFTPTQLYKKGSAAPPVRPEPDTAGLSRAPVQVSAKITAKNIENDRFIMIKVTAKNISDKQINKLGLSWFITDKNGQPAKVDGVIGFWAQRYIDKEIAPGATVTEEWQSESPDGTRMRLIFPKMAAFYNGLKWRAGKH